ncbi:MAG: adenylyl-sulfate kinase [Chlamydiae bacterium]|nr:adenylyl-sulfate kinase [Chlamydiota bacterium]
MRFLFLILSLWTFLEAKTVFWFTGLPCSGKTTIAKHICERFPEMIHLDGDEIRKTLNTDLGFSLEDRQKNLERIAHLVLSKLETAETALVTTISPLEAHRNMVRALFEEAGVDFRIVYVKADLKTCMERDVKGMYEKALQGEIENFTGISSPYEPPIVSDLIFETEKESLQEIAKKFEQFLGLTNEPPSNTKSPPIIIATIPKSGSHLIKIIVSLIANKKYINPSTFIGTAATSFESYLDSEHSPETDFLIFHVEEKPEIEMYLRKYPNSKVILTVRNLKDLIVSAKDYFVQGSPFPYFDEYLFQAYALPLGKWALYNNKQHLIDTMNYMFLFREKGLHRMGIPYWVEDTVWFAENYPHLTWLTNRYPHLIDTMNYMFLFKEQVFSRIGLPYWVEDAVWLVKNHPHTKVIKFEDFFEDHEGLLKQIHSIGEFLGKSLSQEELESIAMQSIGSPLSHTYTDRKKIGRFWEEFDDELTQLFNRYFGQLEILYNHTFGYDSKKFPIR